MAVLEESPLKVKAPTQRAANLKDVYLQPSFSRARSLSIP